MWISFSDAWLNLSLCVELKLEKHGSLWILRFYTVNGHREEQFADFKEAEAREAEIVKGLA
jgi:hypothetical protein